eukprot:285596_1
MFSSTLFILCITIEVLLSVTIINVNEVWKDDFLYDTNELFGWHIFSSTSPPPPTDKDKVYYTPSNKITLGDNGKQYHGTFGKEDNGHVWLRRNFTCSSKSDIYVSYSFAFCETGTADNTRLYLNPAYYTYIQSDSMNVGSITSTPFTDSTALTTVVQVCHTTHSAPSPTPWYSKTKQYFSGTVDGGERWKLVLMQRLSADDEKSMIYDIKVECRQPRIQTPTDFPTNFPTNVPTDFPTVNPTNIPTLLPTYIPTINPTVNPTLTPTNIPTNIPTDVPTNVPTDVPTNEPTDNDELNEAIRGKYVFALIAGGIVAFVFCIAFLIYKYVTKEKRIHISNVLVAIISIEFYNKSDEIEKEVAGQCADLYAVGHDMNNLKQLFKSLNYTVMTNNDKMEWNASEIKQFLEKDVVNELINDRTQYDGLIVSVSSHGLRDNIITSEYEKFDKIAIHRLISQWRKDQKHKQIRDIPRVFIFDSCAGHNSRQMTTDISISELLGQEQKKGVDEKNDNNDIAKGIEYTSVENEWAWSDQNPDYNILKVDAANTGFQAFSDTSKGSYLITFFAEKVKQCLENHNYAMDKPLINIFEEIQYELHKRGLQLIQINSSGKMIKSISLKQNNNYNKNDVYRSMSNLIEAGGHTVKSYSQCLDMDEIEKQNDSYHKPSIMEMNDLQRLKSTAL